MTDSPEPQVKSPRKSKTEREAERQAKLKAELDKPIDPVIWIFLGVILLVITLFMFLDPYGSTNTQTRGAEGVQIVLAVIYGILGKNLATILLGGLGGLSLVVGIIGWVKKRFG